ncbi:MAG: shikimate dehydrogenase [Saprospiraceae bacterium]
MRRFGLIGYPLGHSFSRRYFTEKFLREGRSDCLYELFPLASIGELPNLLAEFPDLEGFNVTIPYKVQILPFLSSLDPASASVGAVNTVSVRNGELRGYNTDVWGFQTSLKGFLPETFKGRALVLGSGGASRAVQYVLRKMGIDFTVVSRRPGPGGLGYTALDAAALQAHSLIVQTTPLGMYPQDHTSPPIPYNLLSKAHYLYDLVYNPEETIFLQKGKEEGAQVKNGLEMLYLQAEKAWEIWNEKPGPI